MPSLSSFILLLSCLAALISCISPPSRPGPVSHFTITALGDLVPSGYTGYKYSIRFLIRDKFNKATLTRCGHTWAKQANFPSQYITCDDPHWQWHYNGQYAECGFSLSLAHSVVSKSDGVKLNTTSYATLLSSQVPCEIGASKNFTCIYGTTGAQLCGLGKGTILQVPVRSITSKSSKIGKKGRRMVEMTLAESVVDVS